MKNLINVVRIIFFFFDNLQVQTYSSNVYMILKKKSNVYMK